jgi:very-short-patch-repair endonuclease
VSDQDLRRDSPPADPPTSSTLEEAAAQCAAILAQLQSARTELLDLSTRNRLLSTPRHQTRAKTIEVVDEKADQVYRKLVGEGRSMSFLPGASSPPAELPLEAEAEIDDLSVFSAMAGSFDPEEEDGTFRRHEDNRLQTNIDGDRLAKRLLQLHTDARTALDEQGFNILFLAIGFLEWYEEEGSDKPRFAPLILTPATLERTSARARFRVSYSEEDLSTNLSLLEKLRNNFNISLPELPEPDELVPSAYFARVAEAIRDQPRWQVHEDDMVLGIFSFSKFLMYKDLDPETWPPHKRIETHPLLGRLLDAGFREEPAFSDDTAVDEITDPVTLPHVLDADSSQTLAIEEVRKGRNLVIQGPPGTGKSQTIANLIATAVRDGGTVLFVAEKRAALEVVKRRMDEIGLGDMCLELHSHKARKKVVLEDLGRTLHLDRPRVDAATISSDLRETRARLNRHAEILHRPLEPSQVTPYQALGALAKLGGQGVSPPDFELLEAASWHPEGVRARVQLVESQASLLQEMGQPDQHPWRGVGLSVLLPTDAQRLFQRIESLRNQLIRVNAIADGLREMLHLEGESFDDLGGLIALARAGSVAPPMDWEALASSVWEERSGEIDELLKEGLVLAATRSKLEGVLTDEVWRQDLSTLRRVLARHGDSVFRWFSREYRETVKELRSYARSDLPKGARLRIAILDALSRGKESLGRIKELDSTGRDAFGDRWRGSDSSWQELVAIAEWEKTTRSGGVLADFRQVLARVQDRREAGELALKLKVALGPVQQDVTSLFDEIELDLGIAFSCQSSQELRPQALVRRFREWIVDEGGLQDWILFQGQDHRLREYGLGDLADRLVDGRVPPDVAKKVFLFTYFEAVIKKAWLEEPGLREFDGRQQSRLVEDFRRLDVSRIKLARAEVRSVHYEGIPKGGGTAGEVGLIRREVEKRRRHLPIRQLMAKAGIAVQKIKPVFMMSPMSVAQFLRPGEIEFDLLLIDEASQVQPVEALGAVARCRRMVVVGDKRQLPPTRFFDALLSDGNDTAGDFTAGDMESILSLSEAMGVRSKMLRWHYRSRHESLIAVSNRSFYDERLFIVPSPLRDGELGIKFRFVHNAVYDRGGSAINRREAQAVADAVIGFAQRYPAKSLGVGTFSVRQRDAVLDELELRRRGRPELERFFAEASAEPFFVKNLEAIQGDERDVVLISIGYGKDASGYMAMNFGPLSNDGGERRLNVLISRARERMEVFTSIRADDIDLNRATAVGARILKRFLRYADTGEMDVPEVGGRDPDSDFEEEVARALVALDHKVVHQVGTAGFFVDLAVVDPKQPGRYLLGIECDGATYHSTRSARDRDRLRQAVLEDRGWKIHRVWSIDWFKDPAGELRKIQQAISDAASQVGIAGPIDPEPTPNEPVGTDPVDPGGEEGPLPIEPEEVEGQLVAEPYIEADFQVASILAPHEVPVVPDLRDIVTRVVDVEGPIHEEEVGRRLARVYGLQRAGNRIREAALRALKAAERAHMIERVESFWSIPGQEPKLRDRSAVVSLTLLKAENLPPGEIRIAISRFVEAHVGCEPLEAIVGATRLFGFQRAGQDLKAVMEKELRFMLRDDELVLRNGRVYVKVADGG